MEQTMDAILSGIDISVGYQHTTIIPPQCVEIPRGKITSIIGPNGCGKSTLLKALSRMMPVQSGQIVLDGQMIAQLPTLEVARRMAILPQSPQAPAASRWKNWLPTALSAPEGLRPLAGGRPPRHSLGAGDHAHGCLGDARHRCAFRRPAAARMDRHGAGPGYAR